MHIVAPSGIGDVSWMWSKLCHVAPLRLDIADGWPYRTTPFVRLLPGVTDSEYALDVRYPDILAFEHAHGWLRPGTTWESIASNGFGRILLEANRHLEEGRPLAEWLPDLPTAYHYTIPQDRESQEDVLWLLNAHPKPWTGVSAASYRGSEAWKTWGYEEWSPFLKSWRELVGGTIFLIGGFWDDLTHTITLRDKYPDLVGKTNPKQLVELLRLLDFYIGFCSGLGVLRTVLRRNVFMLWPEHFNGLRRSWAPPAMIADGTCVDSGWHAPGEVFARAREWASVDFPKIGKSQIASAQAL